MTSPNEGNKGIKKIVSLGTDELNEYDFYDNYYGRGEKIPKVRADIFIYAYEGGGYDGSGIAVWRRKGEWFYHYLGHCSCDGPTAMIETSDKAAHKLPAIIKILSNEYQWRKEVELVTDYLKRYYL